MIQIRKPQKAPLVLTTKGKAQRRKMCVQYARGVREFDFDLRIYAHSTVKRALEKAQYDKCCFCETDFAAVAYGDVEHFRPKKGYRQSVREKLVKPGYYWLAYEWSNLFLSCERCNQQFKKNLFPLLNQDKR